MRLRITALLSIAALFVVAALPASADEGSSQGGYLALGDSVPHEVDIRVCDCSKCGGVRRDLCLPHAKNH